MFRSPVTVGALSHSSLLHLLPPAAVWQFALRQRDDVPHIEIR